MKIYEAVSDLEIKNMPEWKDLESEFPDVEAGSLLADMDSITIEGLNFSGLAEAVVVVREFDEGEVFENAERFFCHFKGVFDEKETPNITSVKPDLKRLLG